ncbi:MAG: phosphate uptake regulator PhoU [Candidatus Nitrosoabyssus spongiisocia]|nr:MAG: phosphate uptake regulator PhoU [Nitrosopumilaceae archaeon AB1(1)]
MAKLRRRLQRIGSSILVCLPKEWVDNNGLDKQSEVEIEYSASSIMITPEKQTRIQKKVEISYPLPKEENIIATITGAYLLGYDVIAIKSKTSITNEAREQIRNTMRRFVGMEITEEDSGKITIQFLLDAATLNPEKLLKRISLLVFGMFNDVLGVSSDKSSLQGLSNRDNEVNRQYFLLVRLLRSSMIDKHLADTFNLESIDSLDYRLAANILENAGDTVVELGELVYNTVIPQIDLEKIHKIFDNFEDAEQRSILSFINNDRSLAIDSIRLHKKYHNDLARFRVQLEKRSRVPLTLLEVLTMIDRITQSWSDIVDLVKPLYK